MNRYLQCALAAILILLIGSCKKDLLQLQKVQTLNSHTTSRLNRIKFLNDSVVLIAGGEKFGDAEVLRSVDNGYTWVHNIIPNVGVGMYGLGVSPSGYIYLCGFYGNTLFSKDHGISWVHNKISIDFAYYVDIAFPTDEKGIVISTILQRNGSICQIDTNLQVKDTFNYSFGLNDIYMPNALTGYVLGYGAVLKTKDGGTTWNFLDINGDNFNGICAIDDNNLWICGYSGSVFHTSDAGAHWERLRNGSDITLPAYRLLSIVFKDSQNGWATCDNGKLIHTDDGGLHWEEYDQFTTSALRSIAICPNGDLLVTGDNGVLFRVIP